MKEPLPGLCLLGMVTAAPDRRAGTIKSKANPAASSTQSERCDDASCAKFATGAAGIKKAAVADDRSWELGREAGGTE